MRLPDPAIEPPVVIHTVDSSTLATSKPAATQSDARHGYSACQGQTTARNSLAIESPDLTAFLTAVGLVRITRLPQGWTIAGAKASLAMPGINIVGMVCDYKGRHPEARKVQKILDWPTPRSTKDARGFIGFCVYYQTFDFSIIGFQNLEIWTFLRISRFWRPFNFSMFACPPFPEIGFPVNTPNSLCRWLP
jgi:hypothetical protein